MSYKLTFLPECGKIYVNQPKGKVNIPLEYKSPKTKLVPKYEEQGSFGE